MHSSSFDHTIGPVKTKYSQLILVLFLCSFTSFLCTCGRAEKSQEVRASNRQGVVTSNPVKEIVMDGLKRPWSMKFLSEQEALLTEKDGELLRINLETGTREPVAGLPTDLADSLRVDTLRMSRWDTYPSAHGHVGKFNAGLLEIALDYDFSENRKVYLSYVAQTSEFGYALRVIRGTLTGNQLEDIDTLLTVPPFTPVMYHFGGGMTFGADDKLYITAGERLFWDSEQPPETIAQNIRDPRGKIYRINPDGSIPEDNPDFGPGAVPGLYAIGIRAAQGLALHPQTGQIWFTEHGTNQGDELNLLQPSANYGWPIETTGKYRGGYAPPELNVVTTRPSWYWLQTVAPTGLAWYFGDEFPDWKGDLLVPGLSRGSLWRVRIEGETVKSLEELLVDDRSRTRKVVVSPEGKIYLLTDEDDGKIIRVRNTNQ
ncbi:MAG: PQQ-dependent sugar dehydrogenase [Lewinella sp.]